MYSNQYYRSAHRRFYLRMALEGLLWSCTGSRGVPYMHFAVVRSRPHHLAVRRKRQRRHPTPAQLPKKLVPLHYFSVPKTATAVGPEGTYVCPSRVCLHEPVSTSHSLIVQSRLADATNVPSSLINTQETQCLPSAKKISTHTTQEVTQNIQVY
jgi:hypothetical protein